MKRLALAVLAIALALAIPKMASAQDYDFTFSGLGPTATGWFYAGADVTGNGGQDVTAGGLTILGMDFDLVRNPTPGQSLVTGGFQWDDLFFKGGNSSNGGMLDVYGLLFYDKTNGDYLNIWFNGANAGYTLYAYDSKIGNYVGVFSATESSTVPEGGAGLLYLLLAGLACFAAMAFRPRNRVGMLEAA